MGKYISDKPKFLCRSCGEFMCDDCMSIAAEYEELYARQKSRLAMLEEDNRELSQRIASLERRLVDTEKVAKLGYPEVMCGYIDSLIKNGDRR